MLFANWLPFMSQSGRTIFEIFFLLVFEDLNEGVWGNHTNFLYCLHFLVLPHPCLLHSCYILPNPWPNHQFQASAHWAWLLLVQFQGCQYVQTMVRDVNQRTNQDHICLRRWLKRFILCIYKSGLQIVNFNPMTPMHMASWVWRNIFKTKCKLSHDENSKIQIFKLTRFM